MTIDLVRRLNETAAWIAAHPSELFRSDTLRPGINLEEIAAVHWPDFVEDVARERRSRVPAQPSILTELVRRGRLLVMYPDATLSDGAAELESAGFFDVRNIPGWDSWVVYSIGEAHSDISYGSLLVSWIPRSAIPRVAAGIAANPEQCIAWAADVSSPLPDPLRKLALA